MFLIFFAPQLLPVNSIIQLTLISTPNCFILSEYTQSTSKMPITDPRYELPRDLEGYGEHSFNPEWPNGAKICISFLLNYE